MHGPDATAPKRCKAGRQEERLKGRQSDPHFRARTPPPLLPRLTSGRRHAGARQRRGPQALVGVARLHRLILCRVAHLCCVSRLSMSPGGQLEHTSLQDAMWWTSLCAMHAFGVGEAASGRLKTPQRSRQSRTLDAAKNSNCRARLAVFLALAQQGKQLCFKFKRSHRLSGADRCTAPRQKPSCEHPPYFFCQLLAHLLAWIPTRAAALEPAANPLAGLKLAVAQRVARVCVRAGSLRRKRDDQRGSRVLSALWRAPYACTTELEGVREVSRDHSPCP